MIAELLSKSRECNNKFIKQGNLTISYQQWYNDAKIISQKINQILPIDSLCIAICLPNSINYAIAYFGILYSNKIIVPISTQSKEIEVLSIINYCEIDMIITDTNNKAIVESSLHKNETRAWIYLIDTNELILVNTHKNYVEKSDILSQDGTIDDVAIMLHTSGTTSNPKRVMLTHNNLLANIRSNIMSLNLTEQDKVLIALPMIFGYCNTAQFLTHVYLQSNIIIMDGVFLPKPFFSLVESEQITNFTGVPPMIAMLLEYKYNDNYDISSLRYICFGGGNMPVEKLKLLIEKYPSVGFVQTYGLTECSPRVTALLPRDSFIKIGSIGKPIPNVAVKVVNHLGKALPPNEIGEIIVKGENVMKGYYKQPHITHDTIKNGWLYTGDLGYYDVDGYFYLTGRIKNIIISGGINIYPEEIEQILLMNDAIKDACVIGEKHELMGEVPIAKIVVNYSISTDDLYLFCSQRLSKYKIPRRFDIVSIIPKTYNGKTKRDYV